MESSPGFQNHDDEIQLDHISRRQRQRLSRVALGSALDTKANRRDASPQSKSIADRTSILPIIRLLSFYKVRSFSIEAEEQWNLRKQWNLRQALGSGASFFVEAAGIPAIAGLSHLRYRNLKDIEHASEARYIDHTDTRWAHDTKVAYKRSTRVLSKPRSMHVPEATIQSDFIDDIMVEVSILCHPPLQRHSNISRLLGVAWINDRRIDETGRDVGMEWPAIVIEHAPHGNLLDLMGSLHFSHAKASLRVKLNLCIDVLAGIAAIHSCGIVHSDIKSENTLVFDADTGQADNWRVRLADFGNAITDLRNSPTDGLVEQEVIGTTFYQAPELDGNSQRVTSETIRATDIWCWGMLVWEVMIGGKLQLGNQKIGEDDMRQLRASRQVAETACAQLSSEYLTQENNAASQIVLETISAALHWNPTQRPSAEALLTRLRQFMGDM